MLGLISVFGFAVSVLLYVLTRTGNYVWYETSAVIMALIFVVMGISDELGRLFYYYDEDDEEDDDSCR